MEIKNYIKYYNNVLPLPALSKFIQYLSKTNWEEARVNRSPKTEDLGVVDFDIRRTYNLALYPLSDSLTNVHWHNVLLNVFMKGYMDYSKTFSNNATDKYFTEITDITALKYEQGGFFKWHYDHCLNFPRTLSAILMLNNDFEGGELCFKYADGTGEWTVPLEPNKLIIWPSNFLFQHTVKPVTKGVKYSVVSWAL